MRRLGEIRNMGMPRFLLAALLLTWAWDASRAQTRITVLDAGEKRPLPRAHVIYGNPEGRDREAAITDLHGITHIPESFTAKNPRIALSISYIGFRTAKDTISRGDEVVYYLKAEQQGLNEVVVTAQYAPNSPDKAVHKIRIIDAKKIEHMAAVNLEDVLTNEMNIRISQDAVLGSGISMQGISGQNVKIMIDGVPVIGRQNGNIDLNQINLTDIERIEIVEGPLSVNYGTDALAGTINIITKKRSEEKTSLRLTSYTETIGTYNLSATAARQLGKARISLGGGRNYFDGWSPGDPPDPNFSRPVADSSRVKSWNPREQHFGRAHIHYPLKKLRLGYRFEYFDERITNRGIPHAPYLERAFDDYYRTGRIDHALTASGKLTNATSLNAVAAFNDYKRQKNTYAKDLTTLEERLTTTPGDQDTSRFHRWMSRASVAVARDSSWLHFEVGYDVNLETALGKRIEGQARSLGDYALFSTAEITPLRGLTVRPGLRYGYNTAYRAPLTPSLHLRYLFKRWAFRISFAQGFRAPALKELYFYFVDINHDIAGNPNLKAEYSNNFSASAKHRRVLRQTIIQWETNVFYNDLRNLITLALAEGSPSEYSYVNVGRSRTQGINTSASLLWKHLKLSVAGAWIGLRNEVAFTHGDPGFAYYPEATSSLTYDWQKARVNASLFYKYQGRLPRVSADANDRLSTTFTGDYHVLDLVLSRPLFREYITLSTGVKNLFNVQNVATGSSEEGLHSGATGSVPVATGRLYFLKFDLQWKQR